MPEQRFTGPAPMMTLGEMKGWLLDIQCGRCGHKARYTCEDLAWRHGSDRRLLRLVCGFYCDALRQGQVAKCFGRPSSIVAMETSSRGKSLTVLRRVTLLDTSVRD